MSVPNKRSLFIDEEDRELSPAECRSKDQLMDILAARKGSGTRDAKSKKKKRSEK